MTSRLARPVLLSLLLACAACGGGSSTSQQQVVNDMNEAAEATRAKARQQVEKGETVDVSNETAALRKTVDDAAGKATGDDAAVLRASSRIMGVIQGAAGKHQAALQSFVDAGGIDPTGMTTADAVAGRRQQLDAFCSANDELRRTVLGVPDQYALMAKQEGASAAAADAATKGFLSTFPQASLLRLRKLDADFCGHARTQLDILGKHAGNWQVDPQQGLVFGDGVPESAIASFNESLAAIQAIGAEQEALQKQIMAQ